MNAEVKSPTEQFIKPMRLTGRCANGAERDGGTIYHAIANGSWFALCGVKPGKRSAGWSSYFGDKVTCPRCLKKMQSKCQSVEAGFLKFPDKPSWVCTDKATMDMQLKGSDGKTYSASICDKCAETILLRVAGQKADGKS